VNLPALCRIDTVDREDALEFLQAQEKLQQKARDAFSGVGVRGM
jgi:hypothetical protein